MPPARESGAVGGENATAGRGRRNANRGKAPPDPPGSRRDQQGTAALPAGTLPALP
jgi:hypothetical protein